MLKNNIEVNISENETKVIAEGNYWRNLNPFNDHEKALRDEFVSQFTSLTKEQIDELLEKKQVTKKVHSAVIKEAMQDYTEAILEEHYLNRELKVMKHIEEVKAYFDKKQSMFNEVTTDNSNTPFNVKITNGIYSLHIWASKYSKNYDIRGYLTINENFSGSHKSIDSFENKSYSDPAKVETYINNKLKKFNHLFLVKKAILAEDVKRFKIHPRIINDLGIQVFESTDDIINYVK